MSGELFFAFVGYDEFFICENVFYAQTVTAAGPQTDLVKIERYFGFPVRKVYEHKRVFVIGQMAEESKTFIAVVRADERRSAFLVLIYAEQILVLDQTEKCVL